MRCEWCNCAAVVLYYMPIVIRFLESEFNSLEALCWLRVQEKENCFIETSLLLRIYKFYHISGASNQSDK